MSSVPYMPAAPGFAGSLVTAALDDALAPGRSTAVLAISGLQGSGKSTFAAQIVAAAQARGLRAASLSIDDVYLTRRQRQHLADRIHPLLATRGPPGTHDLPLALELFAAIREGRPTRLPRFDKLADERLPPSEWTEVPQRLDLLVFEGWFIGTPAEDDAPLIEPLNTLERDADPEGIWRRYCNRALADEYPALWQGWDRLWFLQPPDFSIVSRWRWQQEQAMQAAAPGRSGMSRAQLERFVQFYERVSRQALRRLPAIADHCLPLDAQRRPIER